MRRIRAVNGFENLQFKILLGAARSDPAVRTNPGLLQITKEQRCMVQQDKVNTTKQNKNTNQEPQTWSDRDAL